jgi:hypothetical protein
MLKLRNAREIATKTLLRQQRSRTHYSWQSYSITLAIDFARRPRLQPVFVLECAGLRHGIDDAPSLFYVIFASKKCGGLPSSVHRQASARMRGPAQPNYPRKFDLLIVDEAHNRACGPRHLCHRFVEDACAPCFAVSVAVIRRR